MLGAAPGAHAASVIYWANARTTTAPISYANLDGSVAEATSTSAGRRDSKRNLPAIYEGPTVGGGGSGGNEKGHGEGGSGQGSGLFIRVKCPKSARPGKCKVKLQVESKKKHGKAETKVAKAKIKAGKSKFVKIVPKRKFVAKLDKAKKAIVREVLSAAGSKMRTVRRLRLLHR